LRWFYLRKTPSITPKELEIVFSDLGFPLKADKLENTPQFSIPGNKSFCKSSLIHDEIGGKNRFFEMGFPIRR